jgi:D-alanyl-D-alanine carboxypeptidase (penicillin-binding protein 5/6)
MKIIRRRRWERWLYVLPAVALLGGYGYWSLKRPLPPLNPDQPLVRLQAQTPASKLAWPAAGQSAVGVVGSPILETHGTQAPAAIASTAKIITALTVLHAKPLALREQGPAITLSASDAALYDSYVAQGGSVVRVNAGEQISEYQMLQAMLLPSANNIADSLAVWAFGSLPDYAAAANSYLAQAGLTHTHVGTDASGFAPSTTGTAGDLARLGELAMQDPALAQIAGQTTASGIPVVDSVKNVNFLLGTDNIIGIKTGNTDQAGGVFVSAARATVNGKPVIIVTALVGSPTLFQALKDSLPLIQSAQANFKPAIVITNGAIVGRYRQPWGGSVTAVAAKNLAVNTWGGSVISSTIQLQPVPATAQAGQTAGTVTTPKSSLYGQQSIPVKLQTSPTKPSVWWRLAHPIR